MIGTGMIGGKACGMLLSRAIVRNLACDINEVLEPHDSFFIGSDVYYTYIVDNGFWDIRVRQREETEYFSLAEEFARRLKNGVFSEEMKNHFLHILEYYGQDPFIVRSSSILEDGFGNAFAGKYDLFLRKSWKPGRTPCGIRECHKDRICKLYELVCAGLQKEAGA